MKEGQYDCCLNSFDLFETSSSSASLIPCCHVVMDAGNFQFHSNKLYNNKSVGIKSVVCVVGGFLLVIFLTKSVHNKNNIFYNCCYMVLGCLSFSQLSLVNLWWRGDSLVL